MRSIIVIEYEHNHLEKHERLFYTEIRLFDKFFLILTLEAEKYKMTKATVKVKAKSLRGIENCRVSEVGMSEFAECLQEGPNTCRYALPFGYCFLCKHPHLDKIIENTRKANLVAVELNKN